MAVGIPQNSESAMGECETAPRPPDRAIFAIRPSVRRIDTLKLFGRFGGQCVHRGLLQIAHAFRIEIFPSTLPPARGRTSRACREITNSRLTSQRIATDGSQLVAIPAKSVRGFPRPPGWEREMVTSSTLICVNLATTGSVNPRKMGGS